MYQIELNDLMFFIKSLKHPSVHFNIKDFISFSECNTRSSTYNKLIHTNSPTNSSRHFHFNRLPRLWNSLPPIDLDISLSTIKSTLIDYLWIHFNIHFNSKKHAHIIFSVHALNVFSLLMQQTFHKHYPGSQYIDLTAKPSK